MARRFWWTRQGGRRLGTIPRVSARQRLRGRVMRLMDVGIGHALDTVLEKDPTRYTGPALPEEKR